MKRLRRFTGITLAILAALSILISVYLIFQVWKYKDPVATSINSGLTLVSTTIETTSQALGIADNALGAASTTMTTLVATMESLAKTVEDNQPMIDSLEDLTATILPDSVDGLQNSFASAQESARVIDGVLRAVTSIPFFPGEQYNPQVPLHEALADVSENMGRLPQSFQEMERSLQSTGENLQAFNDQIEQITEDVSEINRSLEETGEILIQYQRVLDDILAVLEKLEKNIPTIVTGAAWVLTFIFLWLMVAQLGLLIQGVHMYTSSGADGEPETEPDESALEGEIDQSPS